MGRASLTPDLVAAADLGMLQLSLVGILLIACTLVALHYTFSE